MSVSFTIHCILILHQVTLDSTKKTPYKFFPYSITIIFGFTLIKEIYTNSLKHMELVVLYFILLWPYLK